MRKAVSLILALTLCVALTVPAFAERSETDKPYAVTGGNIYFDERSGTITGADETVTEAVIPEKINGIAVTKIGHAAFSLSKLASVTIPESVTEIGPWAFSVCPLKSVTIPEGVSKIDILAFSACSELVSIALPSSLTTFDVDEFYGSENLKDIYYAGSEAQWNAIRLIRMEYDETFPITELVGLDHITVHYNGETAQPTTPTQPATPTATPNVVLSPQKLAVNGEAVATEMYNIDNTNYFKLRDLAAMLDGTKNQFNVDFDAARDVIVVTTGAPYTTANGYELQNGADNSASAKASAQSLEIDGKAVTGLSVYNIGGTNFFGLRSLESYLGYEVGYDGATNTATITSK